MALDFATGDKQHHLAISIFEVSGNHFKIDSPFNCFSEKMTNLARCQSS
jgi:hypothetical protein